MSFAWLDYLKDYRKEDVSKAELLIKEKWAKTTAIIKEAFADQYVSKTEALQILKTEFVNEAIAPNCIDVKFLKENLKYVCDKVRDLTEGDIRIIINNGDKKGPAGKSEFDEEYKMNEGKGKKGKGKKGKEEDKKDDEDEEKDDDKKEVIVDEPKDVEDVTDDKEVKEVTITYDKEKKEIEVKEDGETKDTYEVSKSTAEEILEFIKKFYDDKDYAVTFEEVGEDMIDDTDEDKEGKEDVEKDDEEEEIIDQPIEMSFDDQTDEFKEVEEVQEELKVESHKLSWKQFLTENQLVREHGEEFDGDDVAVMDEPTEAKSQDLLDKVVRYEDEFWLVVRVSDDGSELTIKNDQGDTMNVSIADVELTEDTNPMKTQSEIADAGKAPEVADVGEVKEESEPVAESVKFTAPKKKESTGNYTKTSNMKPKKNISDVKKPKIVKKGTSTKAYSAQSNMKTLQKQAEGSPKSPKKDVKGVSTAAFSAHPMKGERNVSDVKIPSATKKPVSTGSFTKKSNMKPEKKMAEGMPKLKK